VTKTEVLICIIVGLIVGFVFGWIDVTYASSWDMQYKMIERAKFYNDLHVQYSYKLDHPQDVATDEQIYNRVNSLWYWTQEYHDNQYDMKEIVLTLYSIIELESGWVNYKHQDGKTGFGLGALQNTTAKIIADMLDEQYNHNLLVADTHKQIQYIVYYFYYLLNREKDINKAIVSYNKGSVYGNKRIEQYYFKVKGRKEHFKEIF